MGQQASGYWQNIDQCGKPLGAKISSQLCVITFALAFELQEINPNHRKMLCIYAIYFPLFMKVKNF